MTKVKCLCVMSKIIRSVSWYMAQVAMLVEEELQKWSGLKTRQEVSQECTTDPLQLLISRRHCPCHHRHPPLPPLLLGLSYHLHSSDPLASVPPPPCWRLLGPHES